MRQLTPSTFGLAVCFISAASIAAGQTKPMTISVTDYRPMSAAVLKLETLSQLPINYEDIRTDFSGDQEDITAGNVTPAQQALATQDGFGRIILIAPRGGTLQANISVDESSGALTNVAATTSALSQLLTAYEASPSNLPGVFRQEVFHGVFFVEPIQIRDVTGKNVPVEPILSTPITLSTKNVNAAETLNEILAQVSRSSGFRVEVGMVPMQALAMKSVTINATQQRADQVLVEFMNNLLPPGRLPLSASIAYRVLYDPQLKYYLFNMVEVGTYKVRFAVAPPSLPPSASPWFKHSKP